MTAEQQPEAEPVEPVLTNGQGVQAGNEAIDLYRTQVAELSGELSSIKANQDTVRDSNATLLEQLVGAYMIEPTEEVTARIQRELGCSTVAAALRELERERAVNNARLDEINAMPQVADLASNIIAGKQNLANTEAALQQEEERLETLDSCENFRWMRTNGNEGPSLLAIIFTLGLVIFFYNRKKAACEKAVQDRFQRGLASLTEEFDALPGQIQTAQARVTSDRQFLDALYALNAERDSLTAAERDFFGNALAQLNDVLRSYLSANPAYKDMRSLVSEDMKLTLTGLLVNSEKLTYLTSMAEKLKGEISARELQIAKISKCVRAWRRKPYKRLRSDKANWLRTMPRNKGRASTRMCGFYGNMNSCVFGFEDYLMYSLLLDGGNMFCPYDAFAHSYDEPLPYGGFVNDVLPDVGEYREEFGAADQAMFNEADPEYDSDANDADAMAAMADDADGSGEGLSDEDGGTDDSAMSDES